MKLTDTNRPRAYHTTHTHNCALTASTIRYPKKHTTPQPKKGRGNNRTPKLGCRFVTVVIANRETPGPIPNPEVKPFSADGTAHASVWESKTPPNNHKTCSPALITVQGNNHFRHSPCQLYSTYGVQSPSCAAFPVIAPIYEIPAARFLTKTREDRVEVGFLALLWENYSYGF